MQKLTVVTVAVAAGVMTFAFSTANGAPLSPRADQGLAVASGKTAMPKATQGAKVKKTATAKVEKAAAVKAKKPVSAKKPAFAKKAVSKRHVKRNRKHIDRTTTASIGPKSKAVSTAASGGTGQYSAIIARYAASYGVPVSLANAVVKIESNYQPNIVGGAGEIGLMQIKPATARMMGYTGSIKGLFNPDTNIRYGMKYLAMARGLGGGTTCGTILKYNAGHAAKRMNPVSAAYCGKVKVQMAALGQPA
ncbi:transglycosylase SLT domain-containing protein [Mesorhizobium sp. STM 4661]|uniref:lytic transglycosylase domain-containing protein n=1 Tax=Mesorhizobium sp. STM 4661 TaxID=1297570 RepID=UPI0002BE96D2|nr:transglycosylase SLT domain-containing protein [Mesorhizobium sp. STM 4661]CCV14822.1 Lytic transglycosylase catalytic [Mesorhizobium sp. STM 4661]